MRIVRLRMLSVCGGPVARGVARRASLAYAPGGVKPGKPGGDRRPAAYRRAAAALLVVAGFAPAGAAAAAGDARAEARRLQTAIRGVHALIGRFTQIVESPGLPAPRIERGTMYLSRPGRVRFEYDEPEGKLAIADGKRAWLYTPEDRQVVVTPLRTGESGIGLLLDESLDVVREFSVDWDGGPEGGARLLRLTPRRRGAPFSHLLVEPGPGSFPASIAVVDPLGGMVTYRFSLVRATDEMDASLFRFVPPPGVEVQEIAP